MDQIELTKTFGAFFAIMNPFINLPIFLALTAEYTIADQRSLAIKVTVFSAAMCAILLLAGQNIIEFFGITIDQFRIAGGLVLAGIAWSMLNGNSITSHHGTKEEKEQAEDLSGIAFYPITFPMVVGPGTIATIIIYTGKANNFTGFLSVGLILSTMIALLFLVLFFASYFGKVLSDKMRVIMTRLMGMILLAISIEMVAAGAIKVLPGLG
ncbi:MAG: MarC family protein [Woeseiaceae bacterium]|nr:MarC family protein [Woeseiaceae bacterium]